MFFEKTLKIETEQCALYMWVWVLVQCGVRSSCHGSTPAFLPALSSVVQDQCRHGAQSLNSALPPKKNIFRQLDLNNKKRSKINDLFNYFLNFYIVRIR